ncbi:hypothetical protein G9A89_002334 [Geosiphon pyriformis]|nr:hypothetical protein G9A89_002334 [Geosiphon pyriformis]
MAYYAKRAYCFSPITGITLGQFSAWINTAEQHNPSGSQSSQTVVVRFAGPLLTYSYMCEIEKRQLVAFKNIPEALINSEFYNEKIIHAVETFVAKLKLFRHYGNVYIFTGHGFGGVLALLTAIAFHEATNRNILIDVTTFGEPRIGNSAFARYVDHRISVNRITHSNDHVPLFFPQLRHHSTEFWIPPVTKFDCHCVKNFKNLEIYKCPTAFRIEHEGCSKQFQPPYPELPAENMRAHLGLYFGYTMGPCT